MNINQAIWNLIDIGDQLEATETVRVQNERGEQVPSFTSGKCYKVIYILRPKHSIQVVGDDGIPHIIEGDYIQHFKLRPLNTLKYPS